MTENPKLEQIMGFDHLSSNCEEIKGDEKICLSDRVNGAQHSDSFVVDMDCFSHLIDKDLNGNSRITRSVSRKGSVRGSEKNIIPKTGNQRNASMLAIATSPTATLHGGGTPEKPPVVTPGTTTHSGSPKRNHQITIKNGALSSPAAKSKHGGNRFGFRHSPPTWSIDPRRILMFFATLSSLGTILLIYFTLSMGKLKGDDNDLN